MAAPAEELTTVPVNILKRSDAISAAAFAVSDTFIGVFRKFVFASPATHCSSGMCSARAVLRMALLSTLAVTRRQTTLTPLGPSSKARFSMKVSIAPNVVPMEVAPPTCPRAGLPVIPTITPEPCLIISRAAFFAVIIRDFAIVDNAAMYSSIVRSTACFPPP